MKNETEVLNMLRVRTAMYIGELSITRLCMFMHGYMWGVLENSNEEDFGRLLGQFTWHLTHKYHILDSIDWCGILLSLKNNNEEEALSLFWVEWDEFISNHCTCPHEHFDTNCEVVWHYCGHRLDEGAVVHPISSDLRLADSDMDSGGKNDTSTDDANESLDEFDKSEQK